MAALLLWATGCAARQPVYRGGAVAADHPLASEVGASVLAMGGNAVDAAVATSFALSVTDPFSCGVGGGGFMVVYAPASHPQGPVEDVLNYREVAPAAVDEQFYVDQPLQDASRIGGTAVGVPGTVAGLFEAHQRWGRLSWEQVLQGAIDAAEHGVVANDAWVDAAHWLRDARADNAHLRAVSRWVWTSLCGDGEVRVGDRVRQPEQAALLRGIATHGPGFFYRGAVAQAIVEAVEASGGVLSTHDLQAYRVQHMRPLVGEDVFGRYRLLTMPPPSSGGVAELQVLGMVSRRWADLAHPAPDDPAWLHLLGSAMQQAFADRARWLADGTFTHVPVDKLLDPEGIAAAADRLDLQRAMPAANAHVLAPADDSGTSHLCVVDGQGMAVACTETINYLWGSCVAVPAWGIVLNDEMDDFTTKPQAANAYGLVQSAGNMPEPGKRPLSSMSPTIVLEGGRVRLVAGASGGPRIISATIQAIVDVLQFGLTPVEALAKARIHQQWKPDVLWLEAGRFDASVHEALAARGWDVRERAGMGVEQLIEVLPDGAMLPASDPRKGGVPAGVVRPVPPAVQAGGRN